jgi:hypothetical protein
MVTEQNNAILQLIPLTDVKEICPDFQKINKMDNCIVMHLRNDTKVVITSSVSSWFWPCESKWCTNKTPLHVGRVGQGNKTTGQVNKWRCVLYRITC